MKKASPFLSLLAAVLLLGSLAATPALADDAIPFAEATPAPTAEPLATPEPLPTPEVQATPAPGDSATARNDKGGAYLIAQTVTDAAGGEIATIERDTRFNLVLRVADYDAYNNYITADQISARINSSVFTFTGNAEIGQLYDETDANGCPYYSYVLLFRDVIYNGGGNSLSINLSYLNSTLAMQQLSVTLGQCVDKDPSTPNLMIRASSYGNEAITAGSPFTLSLSVYATAGQESLNDVVVSLTLPDGVTMTGGSLTNYIGSMSAHSTRDVQFNLSAGSAFTAGVANITVNLVGTGATTNTAVNGMATTISVPISQPDRFEVGQLTVPDTIYVGDSASVSLGFVNKGKNPVSNLEAKITGTNLGVDTAQQYVGNVNAGTENSVDFDLTPTEAGPMSGTITLSYEDANGEIKTVTKDFSATVMELPVYEDPSMTDPSMMEPQKTGMPIWGWALIAIAVVVVLFLVIKVIRRKRKAAALAKLEESEDEDL